MDKSVQPEMYNNAKKPQQELKIIPQNKGSSYESTLKSLKGVMYLSRSVRFWGKCFKQFIVGVTSQ